MPISKYPLAATAVVALLSASPALATDLFGSGPLELQAGGMVIVTPKYEGSKDYQVFGVPLVAPAGSNEFGFIQFRGPKDISASRYHWNGFEAGPLTGWRFDRDENDADRLTGLGDVDGGIVFGGYAAYRFGALRRSSPTAIRSAVMKPEGLLRFGAEAPVTVINGVKMTGQVGATGPMTTIWDAFFSVRVPTPFIAAAYDAESGREGRYIGLNADVPLGDRWNLKLIGQYSRLIAMPPTAPSWKSENQFFGGLGLTYRFTLDR